MKMRSRLQAYKSRALLFAPAAWMIRWTQIRLQSSTEIFPGVEKMRELKQPALA
jgi:hypothetical protein